MLTINKIPVLLLTGYLGSGKTTLLNRILTNNKGIRFAVIVNDIGEVNIDASLIQQGGVVSQKDDSLVALQNGCICCTLQTDLINQLHELAAQKAYDYIVIEASGICEPAPIAQTLCSYAQMVPQFAKDGLPTLDCICSVVDALRLRDEFGNGDKLRYVTKEEDLAALVTEQIEFCNIILLNKASEVSEDELAHVKAIIRAIQPHAEIIETNYCDVPFEKILNTGLFDFDKVATSATWIQEIEDARHHHDDDDDDDDDHDHEDHDHEDHDHEEHDHHHHHHDHEHGEGCTCGCHDHEHHHHHADEVFTSWGKETPHKFERAKIEEILKGFVDSDNILRSKGMVECTDGTWLYFDMVPGEYEIREGEPDYTGRIVVIGTEIHEDELLELFGLN